jgi:hypothetical protein
MVIIALSLLQMLEYTGSKTALKRVLIELESAFSSAQESMIQLRLGRKSERPRWENELLPRSADTGVVYLRKITSGNV